MNTAVRVVGATADPRPWFGRWEALWSRFDPASSLSRLNQAAGRWVAVDPLLHRAVARSLAAAHLTGGAFDPTVLPAMIAAGYSRSFEWGPTPVGQPAPAGRWREVELGPGVVRLPQGVGLDLGGIGKGLAADLAARRIRRSLAGARGRAALSAGGDTGPRRLLVDVGGDMLLWARPGAPPWLVEIEDATDPDLLLGTAILERGAVATSSTLGRRWGDGLHHLIDPWSGRPSDSTLVSATVFAGSAALADVLAKTCIIVGPDRGLALLAQQRCHGVLFTRSGELIRSPGLEAFFHACAE